MQTTEVDLIEQDVDVPLRFKDIEWLLSAATAAALVAYGVTRRSPLGFVLAAAATPLAYRSMTGHWPDAVSTLVGFNDSGDTRVALSGERGIHVREAIRIERPLAEVYQFWRRFENLPQFMRHLERVTELNDGRSHWVARGPGGIRVDWDAEIINEVENKVIGWRSLPESDIAIAGSVNFAAVRDGRSTQLSVNLQYAPPAGQLGAAMATVFGAAPAHTIREDLRRLKQLLEAGEIPRTTSDAATTWPPA